MTTLKDWLEGKQIEPITPEKIQELKVFLSALNLRLSWQVKS